MPKTEVLFHIGARTSKFQNHMTGLFKVLSKVNAQARAVRKNMAGIQKTSKKATGQTGAYADQANRGAQSTRELRQETGQMAFRYAYYSMMMLTAGQALIQGLFIKGWSNAAKAFEKSVTKIIRVSGALPEQFGKLRDSIRATAMELARATPFAPQQIAEGMYEMRKAGVQMNDMLMETVKKGGRVVKQMGALEHALNLTTISGREVAEEAQYLATIMTTWNKAASKAEQITDRLTNAMRQSRYGIAELEKAMSNSQAAAAAMGQDLDELSTFVTMLGRAGTRAARAGTAAKGIIEKISRPDAKKFVETFAGLRDAMAARGELHSSGRDEEFAKSLMNNTSLLQKHRAEIYENGRVVDNLYEIITKAAEGVTSLQDKLKGTKLGAQYMATINEKISKIFGLRYSRYFRALQNSVAALTEGTFETLQDRMEDTNETVKGYLNLTRSQMETIGQGKTVTLEGAQAFKLLRKQINKTGAAGNYVRGILATFHGALSQIKSSTQGLNMMMGKTVNVILEPIVRVVTEAANAVSALLNKVDGGANLMGKMIPFLFTFGTAVAVVSGAALVLGGVMGLLVNRLDDFADHAEDMHRSVGSLSKAFTKLSTGLKNNLSGLSSFAPLMKNIAWSMTKFFGVGAGLFLLYQMNFAGMRDAMKGWGKELEKTGHIGSAVGQKIKNFFAPLAPIFEAIGQGIQNFGKLVRFLSEQFIAIYSWVRPVKQVFRLLYGVLWLAAGAIKAVAGAVGMLIDPIVNLLGGDRLGAVNRGLQIMGTIVGSVLTTGLLNLLASQLYTVASSIVAASASMAGSFLFGGEAIQRAKTLYAVLSKNRDGLLGFKTAMKSIRGKYRRGALSEFLNAGSDSTLGAGRLPTGWGKGGLGGSGFLDHVKRRYHDAAQAVKRTFFQSMPNWLMKGDELVKGFASSLTNGWQRATQAFTMENVLSGWDAVRKRFRSALALDLIQSKEIGGGQMVHTVAGKPYDIMTSKFDAWKKAMEARHPERISMLAGIKNKISKKLGRLRGAWTRSSRRLMALLERKLPRVHSVLRSISSGVKWIVMWFVTQFKAFVGFLASQFASLVAGFQAATWSAAFKEGVMGLVGKLASSFITGVGMLASGIIAALGGTVGTVLLWIGGILTAILAVLTAAAAMFWPKRFRESLELFNLAHIYDSVRYGWGRFTAEVVNKVTWFVGFLIKKWANFWSMVGSHIKGFFSGDNIELNLGEFFGEPPAFWGAGREMFANWGKAIGEWGKGVGKTVASSFGDKFFGLADIWGWDWVGGVEAHAATLNSHQDTLQKSNELARKQKEALEDNTKTAQSGGWWSNIKGFFSGGWLSGEMDWALNVEWNKGKKVKQWFADKKKKTINWTVDLLWGAVDTVQKWYDKAKGFVFGWEADLGWGDVSGILGWVKNKTGDFGFDWVADLEWGDTGDILGWVKSKIGSFGFDWSIDLEWGDTGKVLTWVKNKVGDFGFSWFADLSWGNTGDVLEWVSNKLGDFGFDWKAALEWGETGSILGWVASKTGSFGFDWDADLGWGSTGDVLKWVENKLNDFGFGWKADLGWGKTGDILTWVDNKLGDFGFNWSADLGWGETDGIINWVSNKLGDFSFDWNADLGWGDTGKVLTWVRNKVGDFGFDWSAGLEWGDTGDVLKWVGNKLGDFGFDWKAALGWGSTGGVLKWVENKLNDFGFDWKADLGWGSTGDILSWVNNKLGGFGFDWKADLGWGETGEVLKWVSNKVGSFGFDWDADMGWTDWALDIKSWVDHTAPFLDFNWDTSLNWSSAAKSVKEWIDKARNFKPFSWAAKLTWKTGKDIYKWAKKVMDGFDFSWTAALDPGSMLETVMGWFSDAKTHTLNLASNLMPDFSGTDFGFGSAVTEVHNFLRNSLSPIFTSIKDVLEKTKPIIIRIAEVLATTLSPLVNIIKGLVNFIQNPLKMMKSWSGAIAKGAAQGVGNALKSGAQGFLNNLQGVGVLPLLQTEDNKASGGKVPGSPGEAVPITAHGGERVIPNKATSTTNTGAPPTEFNIEINVDGGGPETGENIKDELLPAIEEAVERRWEELKEESRDAVEFGSMDKKEFFPT